jgi:hypothetical protein
MPNESRRSVGHSRAEHRSLLADPLGPFNLAVGLVAALFLLGLPAAHAAVKKTPFLIYNGTNTQMVVRWQLDASQTCTIQWGLDTDYDAGSAQTTEYGTDHQHQYTITGLTPGTTYYYTVDSVGVGSFVTAPPSTATAVKFFAYGDTRSQPNVQSAVDGRMLSTLTADPAFQTMALHVGDWVSGDSESAWTSEFFNLSYANLTSFHASVPQMGCRGNHEGGGIVYGKYYPYPYVAGFYWSFDYGPAHVAVVDQYTTYTPGSAQYTWLTNDLATTLKPWKLMLFHEPGWGAGTGHGDNTTVQTYLQPVCEAYNVRLVFAGHNHNYARCAVNGVQHLTVGGGGAPLHGVDLGYPNVVVAESSYGHAEITIDGPVLSARIIRTNGSVLEAFSVTNTVNQPPVMGPVTAWTMNNTALALDTAKLLSRASDPDGDTVSIVAVSTASTNGGANVLAAGTITYTPLTDFVGQDQFTFTLSDGRGGFLTNTVDVTVAAVNAGLLNLVSPPRVVGGRFEASFAGIPGVTYTIEWKDRLTDPWQRLTNATAPASGSEIGIIQISQPTGGAEITSRFYRTVYPPN